MKKYIISESLAAAIRAYLGRLPHDEVSPLIEGLEQIEELKDNKK